MPVLRDADRLSFAEIEKKIKDFAQQAKDSTLTLEDLRGGTFTITGNGINGVPNGTIFSGTFSSSSPVTWSVITLADGSHQYTLTGAIEGNGKVGATVQLAVVSGKGLFSGTADLSSGDTSLSVPEPGTLGLLGTGLLGIGGLMRRRLRIG